MTPYELKARELMVLFYNAINRSYSDWIVVSNKKKTILYRQSKSCALAAIDELIKESSPHTYQPEREGLSDTEYWEKVKEVLNKI